MSIPLLQAAPMVIGGGIDLLGLLMQAGQRRRARQEYEQLSGGDIIPGQTSAEDADVVAGNAPGPMFRGGTPEQNRLFQGLFSDLLQRTPEGGLLGRQYAEQEQARLANDQILAAQQQRRGTESAGIKKQLQTIVNNPNVLSQDQIGALVDEARSTNAAASGAARSGLQERTARTGMSPWASAGLGGQIGEAESAANMKALTDWQGFNALQSVGRGDRALQALSNYGLMSEGLMGETEGLRMANKYPTDLGPLIALATALSEGRRAESMGMGSSFANNLQVLGGGLLNTGVEGAYGSAASRAAGAAQPNMFEQMGGMFGGAAAGTAGTAGTLGLLSALGGGGGAFALGKMMVFCIDGDAIISTGRGDIELRDVKVGDDVLTPDGFCRVLKKDFGPPHADNNIFVNLKCSYAGEQRSVILTKTHYVGDRPVEEWRPGDVLPDGAEVVSIELIAAPFDCGDLALENARSYYANGIIVDSMFAQAPHAQAPQGLSAPEASPPAIEAAASPDAETVQCAVEAPEVRRRLLPSTAAVNRAMKLSRLSRLPT